MIQLAETAWRFDGLVNKLTQLGNASRDKQAAANVLFTADRLSLDQLEELYRGDDLSAAIVEVPADEMFREGFDILIEGPEGKKQSEAVIAFLDEHNMLESLHEALCWARAYGGAGVLLGAEDGEDLARPLVLKETDDGPPMSVIERFEWLTVLGPRDLRPAAYFTDPRAQNYGKPSSYELTPQRFTQPLTLVDPSGNRLERPSQQQLQPFLVHASRIVRFDGVPISRRMQQKGGMGMSITGPALTERGWGDSVLLRPYQVVMDFHSAWRGTGLLLSDFAQAIFRIKGLAEMLAKDDGVKKLEERAAAVQVSRGIARAVLMDSEEQFERVTTPVGGLAELLQQFAYRVASAARQPVTLLFGQAPAGLNATGDSDLRNFYARCAADQKKTLLPALKKMLTLIFRAKDGPTDGVEPENWSVRFRPLWKLSEDQESARRLAIAQADKVYLDAGVLLPEEVALSRFGGDEYSVETVLSDERDEDGFLPEPIVPPTDPNNPQGTVPPGGGKPPVGGKPPPAKPIPGKKPGAAKPTKEAA